MTSGGLVLINLVDLQLCFLKCIVLCPVFCVFKVYALQFGCNLKLRDGGGF